MAMPRGNPSPQETEAARKKVEDRLGMTALEFLIDGAIQMRRCGMVKESCDAIAKALPYLHTPAVSAADTSHENQSKVVFYIPHNGREASNAPA